MLRLLIDFILPPTCHICNSRLAGGNRFICPVCLSQLPTTGYLNFKQNPMADRFAGLIPFENATSSYFYARGSQLSQLVHDFKYRLMPDLATLLAAHATEQLSPTGFFDDIDAIIDVPMHFLKKAKRGYNQADYIARGISEKTGIPVFNNLKSVRSHSTQTHLTRVQRQDNLTNSFKVEHPEKLNGLHILLVDDVCTTGATLTSAAEALVTAQPNLKISLFTLAVTP